MKIAFYSPLKPPGHPVPSGDRLMARLLIRCLELSGHEVDVASEFRSFLSDQDKTAMEARQTQAEKEVTRLSELWRENGPPDAWFCYHPYYKAPDLVGPSLCRDFGLPYITAEASYSHRRNKGLWEGIQARTLDAVNIAAVNLCFTGRDERGLRAAAPLARFERLPAFIDPTAFLSNHPTPRERSLVTVAMMRPGDKLSSYQALAEALGLLIHHDWTLDIVGDGPARPEVEAMFSRFPPDRICWHGLKNTDEIAAILSTASIYVWPGHGEAYGLAYLEAQASGLPVVAEEIAGVPEVVIDSRTGILTPAGDTAAYAAAIERLLLSEPARMQMATEAREFAGVERSIEKAASRLDEILARYLGERR
ncbi:glycosyltransferase family 4 protein [Rhizobium sp. XQZ8]|uniref:glycosyltransferase family 4 protein n=1 Tax=Rhizobium populisoli TaxID=2859785 RepID=UPI001C678F40|nr:glycosyltransferase family 4 protein [Rhizobium populisoli]MBW6422397.1 glycosyltransferase family 4 protein [Rhizobium populisoli]